LEAVCGWADDFGDNEGPFPRGRELMHAIGLLDAPEDEVANVEGSFLDVAIVVASKLLIVTSLSHDDSKPLLFEAVEVDTACLLGFFFLIELDVCSSKATSVGSMWLPIRRPERRAKSPWQS
jgi:hypothetical protein